MKYILKRILQTIPVLLIITFLSFGMMRLAGSDVIEQKALNTGEVISAEEVTRAKEELGLDKPFLIQYTVWLNNLVHGDMGTSYVSEKNVSEVFLSKLPATLKLAGTSVLFTIVLSLPLGIISAVRKKTWTDYLIRWLSFIGNSVPSFMVGLLLIYFSGVVLAINVHGVFLPAFTLALAMSAKYIRQIRAVVLEELSKPYVLGEKARGIRFSSTLFKSVLKAVSGSILTMLSLSIGSLLGGTAVIESIFMWNGVGKMAVDAINMRDYPLIQAYVLWMAVIYAGINLLTDVLYHFLDPQIRMKEDA